jgi:hypothetical protein
MPPRHDPYANKTHRRIDIILIVITLALIVFAFRYSAHSRTHESNGNINTPSAAQTSK